MTQNIDINGGRAFMHVSIDNTAHLLRHGLPCTAIAANDQTWTELQGSSYVASLLEKRLPLPGRPTAGSFVSFNFVPHTPFALQIATGHGGVTFRPNSSIILVQTSTARLNDVGVQHIMVDRNPLSPNAVFALDQKEMKIDSGFLRDRKFNAGRNAEFGAGILVLGLLPPSAIELLITATEAVRDELTAKVADASLSIPVVADRSAFFWPPQQRSE